MMNLARNVKITRALNAVAAGQTAQNGAVIDMANYEGVVFIAAFGTLGLRRGDRHKGPAGNSSQPVGCRRSRRHCGLASPIPRTTSSWCSDLFRPAERYVRAVVTRGTADAVIDGVIAIQYGTRVLPVTQDATVAGIETHVSPAEGTA